MHTQMQAQSATDIAEQELVRWAFGQFPPRMLLLGAMGIDGRYCISYEVGAPVIAPVERTTQTLDVLVWPEGQPSRAIAVECKRLKIETATYFTERIGKLSDLEKVVQQANGHVRRGFHQVYVAILAVADSREVSGGFWTGGGLTGRLITIIRESPHFDALDRSVGVLLAEVRQPVDKDVRMSGGFGLIEQSAATPREQQSDLTERIAELAVTKAT